jgi:EAL domain-containing protein (putative c-di-GMP-specific phosphodiesterase class I)
VIEQACGQIAEWKKKGLPVVPVSVNVSSRQLNQGHLSALFQSCMAQHDIAPSQIEIEITESCVLGEDIEVTKELAALEALGVKLLVDDFGTGYSSLSQLQRLDLDVLKVDRAFTAQLGCNKEGEALFMAILSMAHVLGINVVAEGLETIEQLRILRELSCNEVQGYLISPPIQADEMPALMIKRFLLPEFASQQAGRNSGQIELLPLDVA